MAITKKQKAVLDYITNYINDYGYSPTQDEIRNQFNLKSLGSVQRYIKYLIDSGHLQNDNNARRGLVVTEEQSTHSNHEFEIPLLGSVAAGNPIEAIESADESISVPIHFISPNYKHFALKVKGDSMIEDGILNGDIVICRSQATAKNGETVVAIIDNETTLKKFYLNKEFIELRPANSSLTPIIVPKSQENFSIAGLLVGLIRSYVS